MTLERNVRWKNRDLATHAKGLRVEVGDDDVQDRKELYASASEGRVAVYECADFQARGAQDEGRVCDLQRVREVCGHAQNPSRACDQASQPTVEKRG